MTALADAAISGDERALTALVRAYHARVTRFGRKACASPEDADDAVQEAFAKLSRRPDVVSHPGALSWLMTVVRNTCARLLRPFTRRHRALGSSTDRVDDLESSAASPAEALAEFELVREVHAAIAALPEPSRAVVILRDLQGRSGEETSAILGVAAPAMKSRLHRARTELRALLVARGVLADRRAS